MTTPILNKLVEKLDQRAWDIGRGKTHSFEEQAVQRAMIVIYTELSRMIESAIEETKEES